VLEGGWFEVADLEDGAFVEEVGGVELNLEEDS